MAIITRSITLLSRKDTFEVDNNHQDGPKYRRRQRRLLLYHPNHVTSIVTKQFDQSLIYYENQSLAAIYLLRHPERKQEQPRGRCKEKYFVNFK